MDEALMIAASLIIAYFLGSIPSAFIAGRLIKKIDIRQVGSRNMGAMNTFYSLGFIPGALVLATDILKGVAAVAVARALAGISTGGETLVIIEMAAGLVAVLGHNYPVWLNFKGGKGGATLIGVILFLMPWALPISFGVFLLIMAITRFPTLSYSIAMLSFPFIAWLVYHRPDYIAYSALTLLLPFISYIPRIIEMRQKAGSWGRMIRRKSLKDRF
jgi:glycerol-3-phosphate acyltransferase PlsY